ncbi:MAG: VacJ family lipoprotein [Alphaproteobacteria bacterium]|nr:VacJ family lipoprotein [Alphaproteobacteria bacterium]
MAGSSTLQLFSFDFLTKKVAFFIVIVPALFLTSCSHNGNGETAFNNESMIYDPYEEYNRHIFAFNYKVDKYFTHPVIRGYRTVAPEAVRNSVRNALRNLNSPVTFFNQVLQGDIEGAGTVLVRASINSLLGFGGLIDLAAHEGIEYESEDFGQTLAVWGIPHGPYLVVPFIGPSSMRDYTGYFADGAMDPLRWYLFNIEEEHLYYTKSGIGYLDLRDSLMDVLLDLEASSIDYYASVRSTYYQQRQALTEDRARQPIEDVSYTFPEFEDF